jgi:Divergent InlB B-repeat domain
MKAIGSAALVAACLAIAVSACGGGGGSGSGGAVDAQLAVTVIGPTMPAPIAQGRVTSQPAGIDCGSTCNATFAIDTVVTLTAAAPAGQQFSAWSGACSGATATCTVTMSEARAVTATFAPASGGTVYALSVAVSGSGTVSSQPGGIDCGNTCSANFAADTAVTLVAAPASGQVFSSWGGACSGSSATCNVTLSAARSVTAAFIAAPAAGGWSDQTVVSADGAGVPRVGIDAAGNATAIWLQIEPGTSRRNVWSSRRPVGGTWSAPALLESSDIDFIEAELAVDAATGRAMAVWRGATVQEVYARPADAAGVWGATTGINGAGNNVLDLQVGIDANGNAVAVWSQTPSGSTITSVWSNRYSTASGWGSALRVAVAANDAQDLDPSLSVSAGGRAFLVWTRNGSGVMVSHAEPNGAWSDAAVLAAGQVSTGVGAPHVVADANGNATAVWAQGARNSSNQIVTNLASKRFANGAWSGTPAPLYTPVVTNVLSDARLAVNGSGQFAAVWSQPDASVRAVQSDAAGVWGAAATVRAETSLELRGLPDIGIDSLGNIFATWAARSNTPAATPEVWLNRFAPGSGWAQASVHQTSADFTEQPRIAMNDRGHAAMVWTLLGTDGSRVVSRSFTSGR